MIGSLLIANRGEIAVRVIRAARELGIRAVAVHSEADAGAYWTRLADAAIAIGPAPARASYLDIDRLVAAALEAGVDAVHPGYGLLSESAPFAAAVRAAGLIFVGPSADTIALMGDKVLARGAAVASNVPVLPGSDAPVEDETAALAIAEGLGWPVAVKASFGGGGRGLRVAENADMLASALEQARREAAAAFGRSEVFLERYLVRPRHVEVQILGDSHGTIIHLGDRDCSVQRRHQKLLEEAPAPDLSPDLRTRISDAAVRLCRDVGYSGAGTVEFLVDPRSGEFFFLEMNTRLQVEHGVTELVTGVDIVKEQIVIAAGAPLSLRQDQVQVTGHAIQARIAAEGPWDDFRAAPGRIDRLALPAGPWLRSDFGVEAGDTVPVHYDSMFGKVQAWGRDRDEARRRLAIGLDMLTVEGVPSTAPYLRTLLDTPDFAAATHDTGSLERDWSPAEADRPLTAHPTQPTMPQAHSRTVSIPWGGRTIDFAIHGAVDQVGASTPIRAPRQSSTTQSTASDGAATVTSPMDGVVTAVNCAAGQIVSKGAPILLLEAMKMEVVISAPRDGRIDQILVRPGDTVRSGGLLASLAMETIPL